MEINMYKWISKKSNILFILILGFVLFQRLPTIKNNFQQESKFVAAKKVRAYDSDRLIEFPSKNAKVMAIFWATWCGPCKIEMERLKKSVNSGKIPRDAIFAINPFETETEIKKFLRSNQYPFTFIESAGNDFGVTVTPTTLFIDKGTITSMSSGLSIWGIWKAEFFL